MIIRERLAPITLSHRGKYDLQAQVTPGVGSNLVSFSVDGIELIHYDEAGMLAGTSFTGAFNMFPTPCRLDGCSYDFEGRHILQQKHGEKVFIHGLIRDEVMEYRQEASSVASWIEVTPSHPVYEGFPFQCRFILVHELGEDTLTVRFALENRDTCNIPFGYGIHPFWRLHGDREEVTVRVPCDCTLDLKDLVPTGGRTPVAGTALDLRQGRTLSGLFIDNAYWRRVPGATAEVGLARLNKKILFSASGLFSHMIVYAPEGQPFVCVENLTTCPNAPNLVSAGFGEMANMLVAAPGARVEGWVQYRLASLHD